MLENHAFTISFHFTFNMLCNMVPILHAISILNPKQKLSLLLGACLPHGLCYHSRQGFRGIRQLLPRKSIATVGGVPRIPIWTGRKNMPFSLRKSSLLSFIFGLVMKPGLWHQSRVKATKHHQAEFNAHTSCMKTAWSQGRIQKSESESQFLRPAYKNRRLSWNSCNERITTRGNNRNSAHLFNLPVGIPSLYSSRQRNVKYSGYKGRRIGKPM